MRRIEFDELEPFLDEPFNPYSVTENPKLIDEDRETRRRLRQLMSIHAVANGLNPEEAFACYRDYETTSDDMADRCIDIFLYHKKMIDFGLFAKCRSVLSHTENLFRIDIAPEVDGVEPTFELLLTRDDVVYWASKTKVHKAIVETFGHAPSKPGTESSSLLARVKSRFKGR